MTNQLKTEIEKINQGCGKRFEISENRLAICGKYYYDEKEQTLCPTCQAEISALKKGISACKEILNSQQLKSEVSENSSLSEEAQTKGIVGEFNNNVKETSVETAGNPLGFSSQSADTPTLIQQREILIQKEINKFDEDESEILMTLHQLCRNCFDVGFKQALSNRNQEILEIIEKITSWTCKCGCITFDDKKCRMCGSDPAYGEIDYKELKQQLTTEGEGKK